MENILKWTLILHNQALQRECAEILEQMKQLGEAAALYEQASYFDKAAYLYIKLKDWVKIGKLLPHISSPKIQVSNNINIHKYCTMFCIMTYFVICYTFVFPISYLNVLSLLMLEPKKPITDFRRPCLLMRQLVITTMQLGYIWTIWMILNLQLKLSRIRTALKGPSWWQSM